jgi:[ribosomal protein S18]-alanine N-acetyltransferase
MTPEALAALHARCFTDTPRPWSAAEIASVAAAPGAVLVTEPAGFALGRVAGEEAELLTLAVAPEARRHGTGRRLVLAFEAAATARGAREVFLEVAATNLPARGLYGGCGYVEVGRRPGYYRARGREAVAAIVLQKAILDADADACAEGKTD